MGPDFSILSTMMHWMMRDSKLSLPMEETMWLWLTKNMMSLFQNRPIHGYQVSARCLPFNFFELMKKRLNSGGVACIWIHTNMSPMSFKSVVRTFAETFEHVTMWESIVGDDYLLIGSDSAYKLPYEKVDELLIR